MSTNNQDIQTLITKYICGTASPQELKAIDVWVNTSASNKAQFTSLTKKAEKQQFVKDTSDWQRFSQKYNIKPTGTANRKSIIGYLSIAAGIALIVGLSWQVFNKSQSQVLKSYQSETYITVAQTTLRLSNGTTVPLEKQHSTVKIKEHGQSVIIENQEVIKNNAATNETEYNQLHVPYGKTAELTLNDGTKVWLNAGSHLVFPSSFNNNKREVFLNGEGFFDVKHNSDKPFKVLTNEMTFTVLGTAFNINSYVTNEHIDAVLVNGSLHVENNSIFNKHELTLKPGEKSSFNIRTKEIEKHVVNTNLFITWKDGYLTLEQNSLHTLIEQIEDYYNCSIDIPTDLLQLKFSLTGKILLDKDPEQVYKTLSDLIDVTYQIIDDKVIISKH